MFAIILGALVVIYSVAQYADSVIRLDYRQRDCRLKWIGAGFTKPAPNSFGDTPPSVSRR